METAATSLPPVSPAPAGRPFSVGDVIGRAFSVWFANFLPFSIVTLAVNVPVFLLVAFAPEEGPPGLDRLAGFVSSLADLVVIGALTHGVLQALNGTPARVGDLFGKGFAKLGRVFRVSFAYGFLVILGLVLLVVPGVMVFCALYVAVPAVVVEDVGAMEALRRSRALTKGSRWAILAVGLVAIVVGVVAAGGAGALAVLVAPAIPHPIPALFATAVAALVSPLTASAAAVAYHDLRVAKEGVDTAALVKVFE